MSVGSYVVSIQGLVHTGLGLCRRDHLGGKECRLWF